MNPKQIAAEKAVEFIQEGMIVGLGTGSTAYWAIQKLGQRVAEGLNIKAVASSKSSETLASELGIPLVPFADIDFIDVTIDGADEVDSRHNLTKGGGGALLREKILAANSKEFIVIIDESKQVELLGKFPLPVEIVPFAYELTLKRLQDLQCTPVLRTQNGQVFISDNGNYIADCNFASIANPEELTAQLNAIPGVVENGLFTRMAHKIIVGCMDGTLKIK